MRDLIQAAFTTAGRTLRAIVQEEKNLARIEKMAEFIATCFQNGGKALICGNGGSLCDAMHFAEELSGKFRSDRPALPAIALSDPAHLTCVANDYGFENVFSRGVEAYAKPGDVVIGLSTSGNSANVIKALKTAKEAGCATIVLLGRDGGKLAGTCDLEIIVPAQTADRVQEMHTLILHTIIECVEARLFPHQSSGA